jgi:membrane protein DedA with SNARE-associated domain
MSGLGAAITEQGPRLVFLNVLLQQIGIPLPAEPTLVIAGGLVAIGRQSVWGIAGAAVLATLVADLTWFMLGRRYGVRALGLVCRLSSSPERRLRQAEQLFARWGLWAVALFKFVPGLPMTGPVLAGGWGAPLRAFIVYDLLAMTLWGGACIVLGMVFHRDVDRVLAMLARLGGWGFLVVATGVAGLIGWQFLRKWRRERHLSAGTTANAIP